MNTTLDMNRCRDLPAHQPSSRREDRYVVNVIAVAQTIIAKNLAGAAKLLYSI